MLATKFDIDPSEFAFDGSAKSLAMTVRPLLPTYDEAALIWLGWGVMAGSPEVRRLVIDVELDDTPVREPHALKGIA